MDRIPLEIQEYILQQWLISEDQTNVQHLISVSDIRWLFRGHNTINLTWCPGPPEEPTRTLPFFRDILEFERIMCRCGKAGSTIREDTFPLRHNRHISFCNISYMKVDFSILMRIHSLKILLAFECLQTLTDLEISCRDTDLHIMHVITTWISQVPSLEVLRFDSQAVYVSVYNILRKAILTHGTYRNQLTDSGQTQIGLHRSYHISN